MRLLYFRLKGYAGIYHGMGLDEIIIPFDKLTSRVILIQGENGCGKSTILNALSLDIDSSDMYRVDMVYDPQFPDTTQLIPYEAEKEIHLMDGNDIYQVLIQSPVKNNKRGTTKAYIKLNGQEMNPNGNVTSYKEIRNSLLDMDPDYIALSMISSENRGLVDLTPSERKRFMANIMDSLSYYNQVYKVLSKKSIAYKQNINNVKAKIYQIGDPYELKGQIANMDNRIKELDKQKENLIQSIANIKATISILDPDSKIQDLYQSIVDELGTIKTKITKYSNSLRDMYERFSKAFHMDVPEQKETLERCLQEAKERLISNREKLSGRLNMDNELKSRINSINSDMDKIDSELINNDIESKVNDLKDKISLFEETFSAIEVDLSNVTKSDLISAKNLMNILKSGYETVYDNDESIILQALDAIDKNINLQEMMVADQKSLDEIKTYQIDCKNIISDLEWKLKQASVLDYRPKECNIPDCHFIKDALQYDKNQLSIELDKAYSDMKIFEENEQALEESIERYRSIYPVQQIIQTQIVDLIKNNLHVIDSVPENLFSFTKSWKSISDSIANHHIFNEFNDIDFYIGMVDMMEECNTERHQLISLEADLKIYRNNQDTYNHLKDQLKESEDKYQENETEISNLQKDISVDEMMVDEYTKKIEVMDNILEIQRQLNEAEEEKRLLGEKFQKVKDDINKVKGKVDELNGKQDALKLLNDEYNPLKDQLDQKKLQLSRLDSYQNDLDTWMSKYDKIENIKKECSPTSGIQSIYIMMYMSNTIRIANDLLQYLFNGDLQLLPPVINPDEFRIPFISRTGGEVWDISRGSTSQKCMIGMILGFALLTQGSEKYNIIRLDEIDGGLDTYNRLQFVSMILTLMDIMNIEQCIMCSHNIETETYNACIIYVTKKGISFQIPNQ